MKSDLGSDWDSPSPHLMVQRILDGTPPHPTVLWKRLVSSNCQTWKEVLACVRRMGTGQSSSAGARRRGPSHPSTPCPNVPLLLCCCSSSRWHQGHREAEQQPQGAGPRPGQPGLRGAPGSPGGRRRGKCLKISLKRAGQACSRRHLSLVPSHTDTHGQAQPTLLCAAVLPASPRTSENTRPVTYHLSTPGATYLIVGASVSYL